MKNFTLLSALMLIAIGVNAQTEYFRQEFNSSTLADYHGTPVTKNKFDEISTQGSSTVVIDGGKLKINRATGGDGSRVGISRRTLFEGMPETGAAFLKFSMEVTISNNNVDVADGFAFFFTQNANTGASAPGATGRHSFIAIDPRSTPGHFRVRANTSASTDLSGTKTIVSYINNSGAGSGYIGPDGQPNNIGNDKLDIWVVDGSTVTLLLDEVDARDASGFLRNFKIACNNSFVATIAIDNILLEEVPVAPLPVSFNSFTGKNLGQNILLNWDTFSEQNNSHFEIARSSDGKLFTSIGRVQGNGTSQQPHAYTYTDISPLAGTNYYRLAQVDFDGSRTEHSEIVSLKSLVKPNEFKIVSIADGTLTFSIYATENTTGNLLISDLQGRRVYGNKFNLQKGYNNIPVTAINLPNGLFITSLTMQGENYVVKFKK